MRQLQCEDGSASEPFAVHRERAAQFLRRKGSAMQILSGFDSDGATALEPIKEAGGLVFAQKFQTASQPDMPQSAVKTGCVDWLLSPADIAVQLERIGKERALQKNRGLGSLKTSCRKRSRPKTRF